MGCDIHFYVERYTCENYNEPGRDISKERDKKINTIIEDIKPCQEQACPSFIPRKEALFALEVNSGFVKKYKIKTGDRLNF